jgi:hypothetical protein
MNLILKYLKSIGEPQIAIEYVIGLNQGLQFLHRVDRFQIGLNQRTNPLNGDGIALGIAVNHFHKCRLQHWLIAFANWANTKGPAILKFYILFMFL